MKIENGAKPVYPAAIKSREAISADEKQSRKMVQICVVGGEYGSDRVFALCDDGTVWRCCCPTTGDIYLLAQTNGFGWKKLPPIPPEPRPATPAKKKITMDDL